MKMIQFGILGCAGIAYSRFLPAALEVPEVKAVAIASRSNQSKLPDFCGKFGLEAVDTYEELLNRKDLDAVYVPQPPALHYEYALQALKAGKHVFLEKPATISLTQTRELIRLAREKGLALHENYMFQFHSQMETIRSLIADGTLGKIRLYRSSFGFPMREAHDFRYKKELGGGALLDAGGYTLKLAALLLGDSVRVDSAVLNDEAPFDVDLYGSVSLSNEEGMVFQSSFGMDNAYQCKLEIWGSRGRLVADRIFTAPADFAPVLRLETREGVREIQTEPDNHFRKSIEHFLKEISDRAVREAMYASMDRQASLMEDTVLRARG